MFTRKAKPIRIIGDPDNQRPDEWSSTVITITTLEINNINVLISRHYLDIHIAQQRTHI